MDVSNENHVIVVGLAAAPNQNVEEHVGDQIVEEAEHDSEGANISAPGV